MGCPSVELFAEVGNGEKQCVDPDSHGSSFIGLFWIRIRIRDADADDQILKYFANKLI